MFNWISPIYDDSRIMVELHEILGQEFDNINLLLEDISKQMFIQTATWGLELWELRYNLPTNENESYEERRNKIIAKLQKQVTINPLAISTIIKNICGVDIVINEWADEYLFEIRFISAIGVPKEIEEIESVLNKIKPSHLKYKLIFNYRSWNDIKNFGKPWGYWKMLGLTWKDLKEKRNLEANKYKINLLNRSNERTNTIISNSGTIIESSDSNTATSIHNIYIEQGEKVEFTKTDSSKAFKYAFFRDDNSLISIDSNQLNSFIVTAPMGAFKMQVNYPMTGENTIRFKSKEV